jgi:uncharacterized protein
MSHEQPHGAGWPPPYRQVDAQPYWAALEQEQLTYQRCGACGQSVWPAHSHCPHCDARALSWQASGGRGRIYSFSTVMRGPTPLWQSIAPYTVGFVEMDEGYFLFTQFLGKPDALAIGMLVHVKYERRGQQVLPFFAP